MARDDGFFPVDRRVLWVNNPDDNRRHQHKFPQLRLARSVGLKASRSIITNDPAEAEAFFAQARGGVICKPLPMGRHYIDGEHRVAYTRTVPPEEIK